MVKCRYIFDIVIVSVSLPREEFAPEEVDVGVEFRDFKTTITPSRINITEFRDGYGYEYEEETDEVRSSLIPMSLTVNIAQKPMGRGIYKFPEFVLGKIETMSEVQQLERIDLYDPDQPQEEEGEAEAEAGIGTIDIFYRIQPKCQEDEDEEFDGNIEEMAEHLKKTLKENDLLYVIGEKKYLQSCAEDLQLDPPVQPDIALDLSKFRDMSGRLVPTPSILNTCCNPDCCGIQKAARRQAGASMQNKLTCGGINLMRQPKGKGKGKAKCLVCQPDFSSSDSDDESESCTDSGNGIGDVQWGGLPRPRVCLNTPPPELTQAIPITPKCCPVCQTNIDWLPPLAVCPKCNYKPVPIMTEAPYNTNLSAAEILRDYMNRDRPSDPIVCRAAIHQVDDEDLDECGLALQSGNQCKGKRVRQACDNVFPRQKDQQTQSADCQDRKSAGRGGASQQLMQVFDSMKQLFEEADQLQRKHGANQDKCRHLLNQGEEAELTRKMFEPIKNYQQSIAECSNIEKMNERLCFCKGNREEPETQGAPVKGNKKRHIVRIDCKYPCSIRKVVKKPNTDKPRPKNVPGHMGWLWKKDEHAKLGWKPGAVRRQIREIMAFFLPNYPPDTFKTGRPCPKPQQLDGTEKPTLYVCKRNDEYFVTLRPIVDISKCYNPCKQLKPIQFHIKKNPELVEIRKLRDDLLERGYAPCTCNMPVIKCNCRSDREKLQIMMVVMKECCRRGIGNCGERLVLNDENDSEAEFEVGVTPPAAMKRPFTCPLRLATNGTQYNLDDLNVRPRYPLAGDKTARPYQCDIGEKYETKKGKKEVTIVDPKAKGGKAGAKPAAKAKK